MLARHYICIVNTGRGLRTLNMYTQFPAASFPMNSTALDILILFLDQSVPMTNWNYPTLISHRHSPVLDLLWSHEVTSVNRPKKSFTETAQDSLEIVIVFQLQ